MPIESEDLLSETPAGSGYSPFSMQLRNEGTSLSSKGMVAVSIV